MSTIVAKSTNFSYNNVKELENTDKEINLRVVITNESVFRDMIETDDTIIYDK